MASQNGPIKSFTTRFNETGSGLQLELVNMTEQRLKSVEILTIFLKDEEVEGGPSRAHLKFETIPSIQPRQGINMTHRTWIDGKPADAQYDQLERLRVPSAGGQRYVLDISWEDPEGKTQFQRIPLGV